MSEAHIIWSAPVEVPRQEMRHNTPIDPAKHKFFRDVCLRLEQTKETAAIRYDFASREEARLYRSYAMRTIRDNIGLAAASSKLLPSNHGTVYVFFALGPKWHKP